MPAGRGRPSPLLAPGQPGIYKGLLSLITSCSMVGAQR